MSQVKEKHLEDAETEEEFLSTLFKKKFNPMIKELSRLFQREFEYFLMKLLDSDEKNQKKNFSTLFSEKSWQYEQNIYIERLSSEVKSLKNGTKISIKLKERQPTPSGKRSIFKYRIITQEIKSLNSSHSEVNILLGNDSESQININLADAKVITNYNTPVWINFHPEIEVRGKTDKIIFIPKEEFKEEKNVSNVSNASNSLESEFQKAEKMLEWRLNLQDLFKYDFDGATEKLMIMYPKKIQEFLSNKFSTIGVVKRALFISDIFDRYREDVQIRKENALIAKKKEEKIVKFKKFMDTLKIGHILNIVYRATSFRAVIFKFVKSSIHLIREDVEFRISAPTTDEMPIIRRKLPGKYFCLMRYEKITTPSGKILIP